MISNDDLKKIKAIICDVDGVLTDGRVGYGMPDFIKFFHYRDGHWMRMALRAGLKVGIFSGRSSAANRQRAQELGLSFVYENIKDKLDGFQQLLREQNLKPEECMYIGDDAIDMPVMKRVGFAVAVADGIPELDEVADWRTPSPGGHGAVSEAVRKILTAQGKLDEQLARYRR